MAKATIKVDVMGFDAVRRQLQQADEVIDELRTQVDDLTDENNRLRAELAAVTCTEGSDS